MDSICGTGGPGPGPAPAGGWRPGRNAGLYRKRSGELGGAHAVTGILPVPCWRGRELQSIQEQEAGLEPQIGGGEDGSLVAGTGVIQGFPDQGRIADSRLVTLLSHGPPYLLIHCVHSSLSMQAYLDLNRRINACSRHRPPEPGHRIPSVRPSPMPTSCATTHLPDAVRACCGEVNPRTQFVLNQAGVEHPRLLMDVRPTVGQLCRRDVITALEDEAFFEVYRRMQRHRLHALPVVDGAGRITGMLSLSSLLELLMPDAAGHDSPRLVAPEPGPHLPGLRRDLPPRGGPGARHALILSVGAMSYGQFTPGYRNSRPSRPSSSWGTAPPSSGPPSRSAPAAWWSPAATAPEPICWRRPGPRASASSPAPGTPPPPP